jgi:hypothetical protein
MCISQVTPRKFQPLKKSYTESFQNYEALKDGGGKLVEVAWGM